MRHSSLLYFAMLMLSGCGGPQVMTEAARNGSANALNPAETAMRSDQKADEGGADSASADLQRKIIYDAELALIVKEFAAAEKEIPKLVKQFGGYLADVSVNRTQGEQRSGRWQARVPVDQFDSFLDSVSALGIPESRRQTAQDVTEEFVDLEARTANKKRLEGRIVDLLKDSSDELKDVIEVERELARVRGEIEQMQGRLRYLANRAELATITISAREVRDYVPPESPRFFGRIGQAWSDSVLSLKVLGEHIAVAVVYVFPWLLVLGALAPPVWYASKRLRFKLDGGT